MDFKRKEIKQYIFDNVNKNNFGSWSNVLELIKDGELHHQLFNTDYYIIGRYACERWLVDGKLNQTFEVIDYIKEYEEMNFGEVSTNFSEVEHIVNMYVYIVGEELLSEISTLELYKHF
tara:strand:+ start:410 stop:766 length:357 start_codon:yes stop_codon:yes gene_type:complete